MAQPTDRWSWLWLAIGASLLPVAYFQTIWPFAAWLAPVFLMRFTRTQRLAVGLPLLLLAEIIGAAIGLRNRYIPAPVGAPDGPVLIGGGLVWGSLFWLPFVLDRLLAARLPGIARILVYPLAAVTVDFVLVIEPFHSNFGSPAYTQYGDLPLMQLVSLTGPWGLTFMVSWLAPVVNEVWEHGVAPHVLRYSVLPFGLCLLAALVLETPGSPSRPPRR
jgi:apolipoprotein N-acyltransferase